MAAAQTVERLGEVLPSRAFSVSINASVTHTALRLKLPIRKALDDPLECKITGR